jgi:PKD repeat protein
MHHTNWRRRVVAYATGAVVLAGAGTVAVTQPAYAGLYNPIPATEGGPEWSFNSGDALFAFTTSDLKGGDICVVADAPLSGVDAENNCRAKKVWGTTNYVVGIGTTQTLIEAHGLRPGTWRLMTSDHQRPDGTGGGNARISESFTVVPCRPEEGCDPRLGEAAARPIKASAAVSRDAAHKIVIAADAISYVKAIDSGAALALGGWGLAVSLIANTASNYAGAFLSAVGFYTGNGITALTFGNPGEDAALSIMKSIGQNLERMYSDIVADPPDPNFATVEEPTFSTLPAVQDADLSALMVSTDRQRAFGRAVRVAYERYQGALIANDAAGQVRQARAIVTYADALDRELETSAALMEAYSAQIAGRPGLDRPMFLDQAEKSAAAGLRTRIRDDGFRPEEIDQLRALGFDQPDELAAARASLSGSVDEVAVGEKVSTMFTDAARTLREQEEAVDRFANAASLAAVQEVPEPENTAPSASFTSVVPDAQQPRMIAFDGGSSTDADGSVTAYAWDFGDGATGTGATPRHEYAAAGHYTVTLTVTDDDGLTDSVSAPLTVTRLAPTAAIQVEVDAGDGLLAHLDGSGSGSDGGSITGWAWDFGDGTTGEGARVDHTYPAAGTYTARLTVTDDGGAEGTAQTEFTLSAEEPANQPPVAALSVSGVPVAPARLTLDGSASSDTDGTIARYDWELGDGATATGPQVHHEYSGAGTYRVRLTVTDDDGASAVVESEIVVTDPVQPAATCQGRPATIVGDGRAVITGTRKDDVIIGTAAGEDIDGGAGEDLICAGGGDDRVHGGRGEDTLLGGDGADVVDGGPGKDYLYGEAGADSLFGGPARDVLFGGPGQDELDGGPGRNVLFQD